MKHENKNKNNWRNKETNKNESNLGFKNGMLGKFVWEKQANIKKGKGKKNKDNETKHKQWSFEREGKRKSRKKNRIGRKEGF